MGAGEMPEATDFGTVSGAAGDMQEQLVLSTKTEGLGQKG